MNQARDPGQTPFSRRLAVETPEHVVLELELAGMGSRAAAAAVDGLILLLLFSILGFLLAAAEDLGDVAGGWLLALGIALAFLVFWGYFALFEALREGRTPGKRYVGLRVVMDTGHPVTFAAAATRNLVRVVDAQPVFSYLVGLLFVFFHPQNKRLGDIVAGTIVVRDRPEGLALGTAEPAAAEEPEPIDAGLPELSDAEFRLLDQLLQRMDALAPALRWRLIYDLVNRLAPRFPRRDPTPEVFLAQLHESEQAKRRGRFAARRGPGSGAARSHASAERFVTQRRDRWERFRALAIRAERRGLRELTGPEITSFAAQYREVAADLARARTYGVDARVLAYLERVVGAGHNALYGTRGVRRPRLGTLLLRELPAAVVEARAYVLAAFLTFMVPAIAGYALIRQRPAITSEVLPDAIIARAELGRERQREGVGYAEMPSPYLPVMASAIVANNIQVAFAAFAFGITAGIGTVWVLVMNGLHIGAILGLFANYGLGGWILTFVAGHGVLELTAIFIAGGAGLVIARALIAPGDLARRDALVVRGRLALRLVGAAACLLVLAGTIEGFHSASGVPAALKFGVSGASALLLVLYFWNGWMYFRRQSSAPRIQSPG